MSLRFLILRSALLALVLTFAWSATVLAHDGHAVHDGHPVQAGRAADAAPFDGIIAAVAGEKSRHASRGHHDHAGAHGPGHCSFGCSASMLGSGQAGLPRPVARLARSGLEGAHLYGIAFRPPERPPRILG